MTSFLPTNFDIAESSRAVPDLASLLRMSDEELERVDIAAMNLVCAEGLPGAERIDSPGCLRTLDQWAGAVRDATNRALPAFRQNPAKYDNSEALFRAVTIVTTLQRYCGVRYHPAKRDLKLTDPFDLEDLSIHAVIQGPGGTCATLPVVFTAVGRRLGYPLYCVTNGQHCFFRWDDPVTGERINVEGTNQGANSYSDEYYRNWPVKMPPDTERLCGFMRSLTPRQQLALFLEGRGFLIATMMKDHRRALATYLAASDLDPTNRLYEARILTVVREWDEAIWKRRPPGMPHIDVTLQSRKRRWPRMPMNLELKIQQLAAIQQVLDDEQHERDWWGPLRTGNAPKTRVPTAIHVTREEGAPCSIQL